MRTPNAERQTPNVEVGAGRPSRSYLGPATAGLGVRRSSLKHTAARLSLALLLSLPAFAAEPFFAKTDVFTRGTDGYNTYRIPGLVAAKSGALLLFCDGRVNGAGDIGKMNLVMKRSRDGGNTWEKMQVLYSDEGPETKIGNVSAVADLATGAVHAIFCKDVTQAFCLSTTDDGATFGPAVEITETFRQFPYAWKFFATGHAHGIQLASGRLAIPVFLSSTPRSGPERAEKDFRVGTIFSDDHGAHWNPGGLVPEDKLMNESTIYECADGSIVINSRSIRRSARMVARSADAGITWAPPTGDGALRAPSACQASTLVTRDPEGKRVVLFSHSAGPGRSNLTVRLSYDEGRTWPLAKVVESSPAAYGDLAAAPDGTISIAYENGAKGPYEKISVARFNLEWLLAK